MLGKNTRKVATVVAHYKNERFLPECLNALLAQTYKLHSIYVVDDGSGDSFFECVLEWVRQKTRPDFNPKCLSHFNITINNIKINFKALSKNYGVSFARNEALKEILSSNENIDIVCIADSDDIYYPDKVKKSVDILEKYPFVGLVYSDYDVQDVKTGVVQREYKEIFDYRRLQEECIVGNNSIIACSILKKVGLYNTEMKVSEDYLLWMKISDIAGIYHIPESLYLYRLHGKNLTMTTPMSDYGKYVKMAHEERKNVTKKS